MVDDQRRDREEEQEHGKEVKEQGQGMEDMEEELEDSDDEDSDEIEDEGEDEEEQGMEEEELQDDSDEQQNEDEEDEEQSMEEEEQQDSDKEDWGVQQDEAEDEDEADDEDEDEADEDEEEEEAEFDLSVCNLFIPIFPPSQDEFGNGIVPPLPLLFDQVSDGQLPRSEAPLLRLPLGVLGEIVQYLERTSLPSFALVNKDCWQLARSRRFASVLWDCSDSCFPLFRKLVAEGKERACSPRGTTSQPSIGACIRRITVAINAKLFSERHGVNVGQDNGFNSPRSKRIMRKGLASASRHFFGAYLPHLMSVLSSPAILPHLELLDWEDAILLPPLIFETLARSSVKHLKLFRVMIEDDCTVNLLDKWPLETLHLEVDWNRFGSQKKGSTAVCARVLRQCAPTLVSLTWEEGIDGVVHSFTADSEDQLPFPRLRELRLGGNIGFADSASLDALLGGNLVSLSADTEKSAIHKQCFQNRGTIPSLENFAWETRHIPADHPLEFLAANSQLSTLSIPNAAPRALLGTKLLPLLSSSFKSLRSLSLVWEGVEIPASALRIIGTLKTLEQIHLSAGTQKGWRRDWLIDHKAMRTCLGSLPLLQKVALTGDTYDNGLDSRDVSRYYVDRSHHGRVNLWDGEDLTDEELREAFWERLHRERMLREAAEYVDELPKLEWLFLGQIPMAVTPSPGRGGARHAVPLWAERDKCWNIPERDKYCFLLRKMFG